MSPFETFEQFCKTYPTEEACVEALYKSKWPNGFQCPRCQFGAYYIIQTRRLPLFECKKCRHQTSITVGTIMEGSSTNLTQWFQAIFLMSQPSGISALRLSKLLHVTYKTAWLMAHKIRYAMQQADARQLLSGIVKISQIFYGYLNYPDARHPLLIGATLDPHQEPHKVKIKCPHPDHVKSKRRRINQQGIRDFLTKHVDPSITPIESIGIVHPPFNRLRWELTRWLNHTFQGIGAKHLQAYVDEFCFRFNLQMSSDSIISLLMHWSTHTPTLIYRELVRKKPVLHVPWTIWGSKAKWKGWHLTRWHA